MPTPTTTTLDVFGASRKLPHNYVLRSHVDSAFIESLSQDKHVVVHGSSKQGKTSLRRKHLFESDYITITCIRSWKLRDIHSAILKEIYYSETVTTELSSTNGSNTIIEAGIANKGTQEANESTIIKKPLNLDLNNAPEVIRILKDSNFVKFIIIEEFHYLDEETQIDFTQALKAFHELSDITFIIVGVWLEEDKLTTLNHDLIGRIISINADKWTDLDIDSLFSTSEKLLNLRFTSSFKEGIKKYYKGNIFLVQQLCLEACTAQNIHKYVDTTTLVGEDFDLRKEISKILDAQTGRYNNFLLEFCGGFAFTTQELYKWILCPLITEPERYWANGMTAQHMRRILEKAHPNGRKIQIGRLMSALKKVGDLQALKKISPIIIEYNPTRSRLNIVDKGFLAWREFQDIETLLSLADLTDEYQRETSTDTI